MVCEKKCKETKELKSEASNLLLHLLKEGYFYSGMRKKSHDKFILN